MIPWFERLFDFPIQDEMYPSICTRLRTAPGRLEAIVCDSKAPLLIAKPDAGWSAQEHAGHLCDMEALWMERLEDFAAGREAMTPADLQNSKTHGAAHNGRSMTDILAEFGAARTALLRTVEAQNAATFAWTLRHPRMGISMRLVEHLYFVAEHDDHHLARIGALVRKPKQSRPSHKVERAGYDK